MQFRSNSFDRGADWMSNRRKVSPGAPLGPLPDILDDISEHLQPRTRRAAALFVAAVQSSHGSSAALVTGDLSNTRVDISRTARGAPPGGQSTMLMEKLLKGLRRHERALIHALVTSPERGVVSLSAYGKSRSSYDSQRTARAFATGRLVGLLETLSEVLEPQEA